MDIVPWVTRRVPLDMDLFERVSSSGHANEGPLCAEVESWLRERYRARYAVVCASGTAALYLAFKAHTHLESPFVIPRFSFVAVRNAAQLAGCTSIWGPEGMLDPRRLRNVVDDEYDVRVHINGRVSSGPVTYVEDACGAFGTRDFARRANVTCLSFSGSKFVSGGQGGAVVTDDDHVARVALREKNQLVGGAFNLKWNDLSAASVLSHLRRYEELSLWQQQIHDFYWATLSDKLLQFARDTGEFGSWHDCAHESMPRIIDICAAHGVRLRPFLDWFPGRSAFVLERSVAPLVTRGAWLPAIYGGRDDDVRTMEHVSRTINEAVERAEDEEAAT